MKTEKGQFATKKKNQIMKTNAQNSTFANLTSRHKTKVCKRAIFLPQHHAFFLHLLTLPNKEIWL